MAAGVAPRLKAGGLLAGVEDAGVVLPVLNKDGFGVACPKGFRAGAADC